eukprot:COSAG01_NODE_19886_length_983_cov_6.299774_1_plen_93_part_10
MNDATCGPWIKLDCSWSISVDSVRSIRPFDEQLNHHLLHSYRLLRDLLRVLLDDLVGLLSVERHINSTSIRMQHRVLKVSITVLKRKHARAIV